MGKYEYQYNQTSGTQAQDGIVFNLMNTQVAINNQYLYSLKLDTNSLLTKRELTNFDAPIGLQMDVSFKNLAVTPDQTKAIIWSSLSNVKVLALPFGSQIASYIPLAIAGGVIT